MNKVDHNFLDAHRRVCIAKQHGDVIQGPGMWTGLGSPSQYKDMVKLGYMIPVHSPIVPRVSGWYRFVDKGWAEYNRRYKDKPDFFSEEFAAERAKW